MSKETRAIIVVQVLSAIIVLLFVQYTISKNNKECPKTSSTNDTALINSMSARMNQMQMDLFEIKSKINK